MWCDVQRGVGDVLVPNEDDLGLVHANRRLGAFGEDDAELAPLSPRERDLRRGYRRRVLGTVVIGQREAQGVGAGRQFPKFGGAALLRGGAIVGRWSGRFHLDAAK